MEPERNRGGNAARNKPDDAEGEASDDHKHHDSILALPMVEFEFEQDIALFADSDPIPRKKNQTSSSIKSTQPVTLVMGYHTIYDLDNTDLAEYAKQNDATLTFPEKLMLVLMHVDRLSARTAKRVSDFPIFWADDGKAFVIRDQDDLCKNWLPIFFQQTKFSSFVRKLYRWGFRHIKNHSYLKASSPGEVHFGNENFQRDDVSLIANMRSVTAIKSKRERDRLEASTALGTGSNLVRLSGSSTYDPQYLDSLRASVLAPLPSSTPHPLPSQVAPTGSSNVASNPVAQHEVQFIGGIQNAEAVAPLFGLYSNSTAFNFPNLFLQPSSGISTRPVGFTANSLNNHPFLMQPSVLRPENLPQLHTYARQQQPNAPENESNQQAIVQALQQMLNQTQHQNPSNHSDSAP